MEFATKKVTFKKEQMLLNALKKKICKEKFTEKLYIYGYILFMYYYWNILVSCIIFLRDSIFKYSQNIFKFYFRYKCIYYV